jgi:hypothetical protein
MSPAPRTGDDPTRKQPGGSRTETKIAEESELGSDNARGEGLKPDKPIPKKPDFGNKPSG